MDDYIVDHEMHFIWCKENHNEKHQKVQNEALNFTF